MNPNETPLEFQEPTDLHELDNIRMTKRTMIDNLPHNLIVDLKKREL